MMIISSFYDFNQEDVVIKKPLRTSEGLLSLKKTSLNSYLILAITVFLNLPRNLSNLQRM
jgi:hypothetical protein